MIVGNLLFVLRGGINEKGLAAIFAYKQSGLSARDRLVSIAST
jgi:hypothetical protein